MITKTLFPGRYIQGVDALKRLAEEIKRFAQAGFLVCDPFVLENPLPHSDMLVGASSGNKAERFGGESSDEEIERLSGLADKAKARVIVGIGGGKTLDTAKAVAYTMEQPVIIVPTIASTDAPCSALSVIYTPEGKFKRYLILPRNPDVVLVDTGLIARAPARFLVSGMGDALATWFEASSCKAKFAPNITGDVGSMTAYSLARLCYDTLLEYGLTAKISCEAHAVTPALEHVVEANTLLSGLGFESGGLATAHAIHNGFTVLEKVHDQHHGEKVAFGTLASLFLTDKPSSLIDEVYSFCESVGLPTTFEGIGLGDVSDQELTKVAEAACAENETIHNEPIPVDANMVFSALKAADGEGRRRNVHGSPKGRSRT
jgi:glycerol dehydrogenase